MVRVPELELKKRRAALNQLDMEFQDWRPHYLELARFILPRQYEWLSLSTSGSTAPSADSGVAVNTRPSASRRHNTSILDSAGTEAARTLAHGLMNGITSPARPWFRLRLSTFPDDVEGYPLEYVRWLDECARRMLMVMAESNFYNAMGTLYVDLVVFGSGSFLIYEDFDEIIRCYNSPVGEFRFIQDARRMVIGFARTFHLTVKQLVERFGIENVSEQIALSYRNGGASLFRGVTVHHLIENNVDNSIPVPRRFAFRELYWESTQSDGTLLELSAFTERPFVGARWDLTGNDTYGTCPAMDALPDIKQLQTTVKQKVQSLDKMNRPPLILDQALQSAPDALLPGGVTYVPANSFGGKPIYTVQPPVGELSAEIETLINRIRRLFYNNLFRNVSDLQTVRSATEIAERKAEDMVLLGPVLERFENEALDPAILRVFRIMLRKGLFPPVPPGLDPEVLDIQYVSVLADAQRAVGTASIERFMQVIGELAAINPEVLRIPNFPELIREYASRLNVPAQGLNSREEVNALLAQERQQVEAQQAALVGQELTSAAKNLSETEVGSGRSALDRLLSG